MKPPYLSTPDLWEVGNGGCSLGFPLLGTQPRPGGDLHPCRPARGGGERDPCAGDGLWWDLGVVHPPGANT